MSARPQITSAALALAIASCTVDPLYRPVPSGPLKMHETMLVGRIELVPPLGRTEQTIRDEQWRGKAMLITSRDETPPKRIGIEELGNRIDVPLNETFYVSGPGVPFFVVDASVLMREPTSRDPVGARAPLPAGFQVNIRPSDRAIYLGTLRYHRDEFFRITQVEVVDEYPKELAEFAKRFGPLTELRRATLRVRDGAP